MLNSESNQYSSDAVSPEYIAAVIDPSSDVARQPNAFATPSSMAKGRAIFNVVTNAYGNAGVYVFADAPTSAGSAFNDSFLTVLNDSSFTPVTGV